MCDNDNTSSLLVICVCLKMWQIENKFFPLATEKKINTSYKYFYFLLYAVFFFSIDISFFGFGRLDIDKGSQ